jgi:Rrf2 family protein
MAQQGILEAAQGAHGGYRLAGDLSKVTMFDLSRMIVGPFGITDCVGDDRKCSRMEDCILKNAMGQLNNRIHKVLKEVDVSEMIGKHA